LENREGEDDKMSGGVWKVVETKAGEVRVAKTERKRDKRGSRKEVRRKGKREGEGTEETKEGNRCEEGSRKVGNLGRGGRSSKVRRESKKTGPRKVP